MIEDGLFEKFPCDAVFAIHNKPGVPLGHLVSRPGPLLAAADRIVIEIEGMGSHAAKPHLGVDPVVVGAQIVSQVQTIVSRNVDPIHSGLISICQFHAGSADNVIPQTATLRGTARSLLPEVRDTLENRLRDIVEGTAKTYGARATLTYGRNYPVTRNHERETEFATAVASAVVGKEAVDPNTPPLMGGEDFSFMLEARPGAFIFIGNGDSAGLHHPAYDFNDEAIPAGIAFWARLVETAMPK
jgi:hippurate hydrolase